MGRHSGFIACAAALASADVDVVLIPEVHAELDGPCGLLGTSSAGSPATATP